MKVSIDGIIGSAQKLNSQRTHDEQTKSSKKDSNKTDSLDLTKRIDHRLESIENDFKSVQTSLTKNQTIRDGIKQLFTYTEKDANQQSEAVDNVTFEGKPVLKEMVQQPLNDENLKLAVEDIDKKISDDITTIKKLQVELDNIQAADLVDAKKVNEAMESINSVFAELNNVSSISSLRPDAVLKLSK